MNPYFQLAIPKVDYPTNESVESLTKEIISLLMDKGFIASVKEKHELEAQGTVLNIEVPHVNRDTEKECMKIISKFSKEKNCSYRFRFPTFIEDNGQGGKQT